MQARKVSPNGTLSADERENLCGACSRPLYTRAMPVLFADLSYREVFSMAENRNFFKRFLFSDFLSKKSEGGKIAYLGAVTALMVVGNVIEFKLLDTQFSFTLFLSVLAGIMLGAGSGFFVCMLGDGIGFLLHPYNVYMVWVGLTVATCALIGGLVFTFLKPKIKGRIFLQTAIVCVLTFFICTVGINSTGFYFYNLKMGFSTAVVEYVSQKFGTGVTYFGYVAYRLIFKLQILNSLFNYILLFIALPILGKRLKGVFGNVLEDEKTENN